MKLQPLLNYSEMSFHKSGSSLTPGFSYKRKCKHLKVGNYWHFIVSKIAINKTLKNIY